jgi:hypothetical protein
VEGGFLVGSIVMEASKSRQFHTYCLLMILSYFVVPLWLMFCIFCTFFVCFDTVSRLKVNLSKSELVLVGVFEVVEKLVVRL